MTSSTTTFVGSWGACDDDILARLHQDLLTAGDRSIFSLAFSVSNHSPWEFPDGRSVPYTAPGEELERANPVRYADAALAKFFEQARAAPYWKDTVFVVVADHDARVAGASRMPVRSTWRRPCSPARSLGDDQRAPGTAQLRLDR